MGKGLKGLFWGAIVGVVTGILLAPKKGEETRKKVKEVIDAVREKGEKLAGVEKKAK